MADERKPEPNPPKQLENYPDNTLNNNGNVLKANLWRIFFEKRMLQSSYDVYVKPEDNKVWVRQNSLNVNIDEQHAVNNISQLCQDEAYAIADQIYNWLESARKTVNSKGANHPGAYVEGEVHFVASNDKCGIDFNGR